MLQMANLYILTLLQSSRRLSPRLSLLSFIGILLWIGIDLTSARQCSDVTNRAGASGDGNSTPNPIVWRNQPQIHVVNWVNENLCNNVQECYGTDDENQTSAHFPQLCPLYVQHGDPIYFVSGPSEKDFLNPIAVSQNDFSNCSLITYPYYWKVTTFPKRHSLKVPNKFLFPGDHHFVQIPFLGSPGCETGFRLRVTVRTQDCTVPSYPNNPCFGNGYCVFIDKNSPGQSVNESCEIDDDTNNPLLQGLQAFKCKCRVPFKGRYCEDYDACWNHQCQNGGVCHDLRKGINNREYTCSCPLNYIGKHCEFVKSCFEGLCQNGGQCFYDTSRPAHFQCVCQPAFSGNRCEISTGPGPGQQQLTVLTDNLIREQEQRDRALQDQDKMVKTIDQMGGENLTRLSYPRIIIPDFLIGGGRPGATPPPSCAITPGRDPKELDCGVCGCPNGGICIREKAPGPNSCFCPPGVAGPSCKSLAGVCTYAQPCINGGTCLERMTTMEGGASGSGQGDQDDSETLMFPAPGENPAPPPTISWSLLTATPPSPLGENAQNVQSNQGSNVNPNQNQPSEPYVCLCPTGFYGFTCQNTKEELCTTSDGRASGITIIPGTGTGVQDLDATTVIANALCMNGGTPVGTECLCTSQYAGPRCENIATVMIIPDTRGPSTGLTGPGGIVLIPGQPGGIGTSTVSPLVGGTPTATGLGQTGEVCVENQQCQNKGVCVREEGRESKCVCPIGFAGKTCEKNINLDNPLFTGDSFIRTTEPTNWDTSGRLTFDVDMIPQTGSGTVFKVVNGGMNPPNTNVTFQLYLKDGQLHYDIVNVPSGTVIAQVISSNPDVVGNMNKISIENHFTPGTNRLGTILFIVDNDKSKTRDVATVSNATLSPSNIDIKLAPQSDVYIGAPSGQAVLKSPDVGVEAGTTAGSVPVEKMDKGSEGNFKGSITSFKINGKPIPIGKPGQEGYGLINATPGSCNNLCRNGGVCKIEGWKASCVCPEGFQGFFCESRSCNHCKNGAMCIDLRGNDNFACLCQFGWTGVQCEQKMDIEVKDTYKFNGIKFGYPSFVNFYPVNTLTDSTGFDIKFKFMIDDPNSPAWRNSMLMFAGQNTAQTSQPSYLVVGLQAGHIVYRFDAGGSAGEMSSSNENGSPPNEGMRELITSQPLDQSIPAHEVRFGRKNGDSWLYVDGQEGVFDKIGNMANGTLDIWNGLYIGGYKTFLMLLLPRGASVFRNGFKGCIYDINVKPPGESQTYQPILQSGAKLANSLNVLPCFKDALCKSGDSCKNGGQCVELGANFHCRCSSPQFTGPTCENVDSTYTTTTISNAIQTNIGGVILPGGLPVTSGTEDENTGLGTSAAGRRSQCELIIDNSLSEAFSVNIKFAGNPDTDQIIIVLNIMAENKSLYKLTFILDFKPLLNIKPGESLAIKDDVFVLPLNNSMTIRNFTLSKIKSKLTINVNDVVHDLKVNITNHEIIHSLSLGLGNLQKNATGLIIEKTNQSFCYKTAELIIQNSIINIEDYFNCNMIEKCKE